MVFIITDHLCYGLHKKRLNGELTSILYRYVLGKGAFKTFYLNDANSYCSQTFIRDDKMGMFCGLCFHWPNFSAIVFIAVRIYVMFDYMNHNCSDVGTYIMITLILCFDFKSHLHCKGIFLFLLFFICTKGVFKNCVCI